MRKKTIRAIKALWDHLNSPIETYHPQMNFIPPIVYRVILYSLSIYIIAMMILKGCVAWF